MLVVSSSLQKRLLLRPIVCHCFHHCTDPMVPAPFPTTVSTASPPLESRSVDSPKISHITVSRSPWYGACTETARTKFVLFDHGTLPGYHHCECVLAESWGASTASILLLILQTGDFPTQTSIVRLSCRRSLCFSLERNWNLCRIVVQLTASGRTQTDNQRLLHWQNKNVSTLRDTASWLFILRRFAKCDINTMSSPLELVQLSSPPCHVYRATFLMQSLRSL